MMLGKLMRINYDDNDVVKLMRINYDDYDAGEADENKFWWLWCCGNWWE